MFRLQFDTSSEAAAIDVRTQLLTYLERETGFGRDMLPVEEIFNELVSNVLLHGDRWATMAVIWRSDGTCSLQVTDEGPGVDLSGWQPPATLSEHGHGLVILGGLSRDVAVADGPGGVGTRISAALPIHVRILRNPQQAGTAAA